MDTETEGVVGGFYWVKAGLFCTERFPVRQIPDDLLLDIYPKNVGFSTKCFFSMIFFLSIIPKNSEFLTFFNHLPQKDLCLANFSNFCLDLIHS